MTDGKTILKTRFHKRLAVALLIGLAGFAWGWVLSEFTFGLGLRRASYDLPFLIRDSLPFLKHEKAAPKDIVLVAMNEVSHAALDQSLSRAWDRRLHGNLVDKLTAAGARMIVFDILFGGDFGVGTLERKR